MSSGRLTITVHPLAILIRNAKWLHLSCVFCRSRIRGKNQSMHDLCIHSASNVLSVLILKSWASAYMRNSNTFGIGICTVFVRIWFAINHQFTTKESPNYFEYSAYSNSFGDIYWETKGERPKWYNSTSKPASVDVTIDDVIFARDRKFLRKSCRLHNDDNWYANQTIYFHHTKLSRLFILWLKCFFQFVYDSLSMNAINLTSALQLIARTTSVTYMVLYHWLAIDWNVYCMASFE